MKAAELFAISNGTKINNIPLNKYALEVYEQFITPLLKKAAENGQFNYTISFSKIALYGIKDLDDLVPFLRNDGFTCNYYSNVLIISWDKPTMGSF